MIVLHPYAPDARPADQLPTWEALGNLDMTGITEVRHVRCTGQFDYARALAQVYEDGDAAIIVEHDITWTHEQWGDIRWCRKPFCAFDYEVGPCRLWSDIPGGLGLGLAKVRVDGWEHITQTPAVPIVPWSQVAGALVDRLPPVHLHRPPVWHHHRY